MGLIPLDDVVPETIEGEKDEETSSVQDRKRVLGKAKPGPSCVQANTQVRFLVSMDRFATLLIL